MKGTDTKSRRFRPLPFAIIALTTACLPLRTCFAGTDRPASLNDIGVRVGRGWLASDTFHENARLGSVTQIVRRKTGELAIVGTHAAAFLPAQGGLPRVVAIRPEAGEAELIEWASGPPRYIDRGGGGWQTGALIGEDGGRLWQPEGLNGMNDLAARDVDGDGIPELAVGYNGAGGVHLYDAAGTRRWRQDDGNVWHVEIVDTDADGRPEIVHSNASGELTIREASGSVRLRASPEGYFSQFSLVEWPRGQSGLLHARDDGAQVVGFDGETRVRLATPDSSFLMNAHGTVARFDGDDHLVLTLSMSNWDRTQLVVFDGSGALRYREVVAGRCDAVAALEPDAFLFGCGRTVLRYAVRR